jgi:DNA-binding NarL/FixJ family response regulator
VNKPADVLPLVGRRAELAVLRRALSDAEKGVSRVILLFGESGIGKSRLLDQLEQDASSRGWGVSRGKAYPVETGVPYALFSDALLPALRRMGPETRAVLMRGIEDELAYMFPILASAQNVHAARAMVDDPQDFKHRLHWNFTEFLRELSSRQPRLILLEDLQWADASSLELLHFVARQVTTSCVVILCTCRDDGPASSPFLRKTLHSLLSLPDVSRHEVGPLTLGDTQDLLTRVFSVTADTVRAFAALLYGWTRGNPLFIDQTLKQLVADRRLKYEDGRWFGWDIDHLELPMSLRNTLIERMRDLSPGARAVADVAAVVGAPAEHSLLHALSGLDEDRLIAALEELRVARIMEERTSRDVLRHDFTHPLLRETLYSDLSQARVRALHVRVGEALERVHVHETEKHMGEIAYHFVRAHSRGADGRAVLFLAQAGRAALGKYANREAVDYLAQAVERAARIAPGETGTLEIMADHARAQQRVGEHAAAQRTWTRIREVAASTGQTHLVMQSCSRLASLALWSGRAEEAIGLYDEALAAGDIISDIPEISRIALAKCIALLEIGQATLAEAEATRALSLVGPDGAPEVLARLHRALLLIHIWVGPPERALVHGLAAIEHASRAGDAGLLLSAHWGLSFFGGLTGNAALARGHLIESQHIAEQANSPVLRLWAAEVAIEYHAATGDWDHALEVGMNGIRLARALEQRAILPRLLIWTAMVHMARNDMALARAELDEAWEVSGAASHNDNTGKATHRAYNIHTVVPAHTGLAAYHLTNGDWDEAIRIAERGLAIADRSGYAVWAVHRLLPVLAEAHLQRNDLDRARVVGARLRADAERLGNTLGIAWADTCDALIAWLSGDSHTGAKVLRAAAESLEAIPYVYDAARVRRQLAGRLADIGDRDGALRELRFVHDAFTRLGAERELEKVREQFRELGARLPARSSVERATLTSQEEKIANLASAGRSNKAIATALGISSRTVGTHLTNIFRKLGVSSREELANRLETMP